MNSMFLSVSRGPLVNRPISQIHPRPVVGLLEDHEVSHDQGGNGRPELL